MVYYFVPEWFLDWEVPAPCERPFLDWEFPILEAWLGWESPALDCLDWAIPVGEILLATLGLARVIYDSSSDIEGDSVCIWQSLTHTSRATF